MSAWDRDYDDRPPFPWGVAIVSAILSAVTIWTLIGFHIIPHARDLFRLCAG